MRHVKSSREKVQAHRRRLRKKGLRPVQIWVPDTRSRTFAAEAHRQSLAVARSPMGVEDQAFVDAVSEWNDAWLTTDQTDAPLLRLPVEPADENGLRIPARVMVDKITSVPKARIGRRIGRLSDEDVTRLNRAVVIFLGLAGASRR